MPKDICAMKMQSYLWDFGIYCSDLELCALGLDLSMDYRDKLSASPNPSESTCVMFLNNAKLSCNSIIEQLRSVHILQG